MADSRRVLSVQFVAEGIKETAAQFDQLGKDGAAAAKRITDAFKGSTVGGALSNQMRAIRIELANTVVAAQRFGQSWASARTAMGAFGGAIANTIRNIALMKAALLGAVAGIGMLAKGFGETAEKIQNQASALGLTTDQYQRLTAAARDTGIEQSRLDRILTKFTIGVEDAGDEAEKAGDKVGKAAKSFEELSVAAEDGTEKTISVSRGISEATKAVAGFEGVTKKGVEGLKQYAANLAKVTSTTEQLAIVSRDFGTRGAAETLTFLRNLAFQFDDTARAAAGLIQPLSQNEIAIGVELDSAFDNLATNLLIIKDRIIAVFGPAITEVVKLLTFLIKDNEQTFLSWAREVRNQAIQVILDFLAILRGANGEVKNQWLIGLVEGVTAFGKAMRYVFLELIPQAFGYLLSGADKVASVLNGLFGTQFTGGAVLILAIFLQLSGAIGIVAGALALAAAAGQLLWSGLALAARAGGLLLVALRPVALALGYIGAALAALLGIPAGLGVAIVAGLAAAAVAIYVYWDEIVAYSQDAWQSIVGFALDAAKGITDAFTYLKDEVPGIVGDMFSNAYAYAEEKTISTAETIRSKFVTLWDGLDTLARDAWDGIVAIVSAAATGVANAVSTVATAAYEAWTGASSTVADAAASIIDSISKATDLAGGIEGARQLAQQLIAPFTDAKTEIMRLWAELPGLLEGQTAALVAALTDGLVSLQSLPTAISEALAAIPSTIALASETATAAFATLSEALISQAQNLKVQIEGIFAGIGANISFEGLLSGFEQVGAGLLQSFGEITSLIVAQTQDMVAQVSQALQGLSSAALSGIAQSFVAVASAIVNAWAGAMRSIQQQTAQMVSSVSSLISRLVSYLERLRAAIARAKAEASSGGSGGSTSKATGGYVSGAGTGTSDSIPAWLSNGEFVIKARSVRKWGLGILSALNAGRFPDQLRQGFADGGLVSQMASAFNTGSTIKALSEKGGGSRLQPVTLAIGGREFAGFMAPPNVLAEIGKTAVISRLASPGRRPKWKA